MEYLVLGPLEVHSDSGAAPTVRRGRPRSLLHLLLLHRRVVLPVDVIGDRLWERDVPRDTANAVHQLVSYLRRVLGPEGRDHLVTSPVGYQLDVPDDHVDVWRFDQLLHRATLDLAPGSTQAVRRALEAAEDAARLWRGDPYPESDGYEWASGDINRLKESYLQLQETRLEAMLRLGRHAEVALEAQSLAAAYPLREQFHGQRALALYRGGRQSEALDALRKLRHLLAEEMGLDPGQPLQALEQAILRQDPDLAWQPAEATEANGAAREVLTASPASALPEPSTAEFPVPHLPPRPPPLLGRDSDARRVTDLLQPGGLVTLTGVAGIGKSALARSVAHGWPAAVWYAELSDVDTPELAPAAVARQAGFTGQLPSDPTTVLVAGFRTAAGLLVVDTCEHLLPILAATLERIRQDAPDLAILATSRRPLDLPEERIVRLDPLQVPPDDAELDADAVTTFPAVQLFLDRARRVRSDFRLDAQTTADVAELVGSVDGIPLAIELAAANADVLSAAMIKERLTHHLGTALASTSARPRRQASLQAALDASRVLLGEREGQLFLKLAALRGSFDLDAVRALVPDDFGDPYDALASLVRQSLVTHEGGSTYRLLRPVRTYAADHLAAAPERRLVLERHAAHVAVVSRQASRELRTSKDALTRLQRLAPDARAAMEWALENHRPEEAADIAVSYTWHWAINGLAPEGMRWLERVLGEIRGLGDATVDPIRQAAVLHAIGLLANPMGRVRDARDHCRRAIELSRSSGDEVGMTAALLTLGIAEWALGDLNAAAHAHDLAMEKAAVTGDRWHHLAALTLRARTALDAGEPRVEELLEAALETAQDQDERQLLSIALSLLGRHHLEAGRVPTAELAAEQALQAARSINYREGELSALNLLGRVRLSNGLLESATDCFMCALSVASDADHRGALCETVESLALAAAASGRHEHAYLLLQASARERARLGLHLPSFAETAVTETHASTATVLGGAAGLVDARVKFLRFDDLVRELLSAPPGGGATLQPHAARSDGAVTSASAGPVPGSSRSGS